MPPSRPLERVFCAAAPAVLALIVTVAVAPPARALRIVNYNITNYPGLNLAGRQPHFRTVLAPLGADIVVVQEMQSQAGVDSFRTNVLNVIEPGQWASAPFINGNDTDNALFYKPATVQFLGQWAWYPPEPPGVTPNLRLVNCYRLMPVGYAAAAAELRIYSQHLKASNTSTDANRRFYEASGIRDSMNAVPPGTHCILTGDFNIYSGAEAAFTKLLESQADNDGRVYDPLNAPLSTWNTPSLAAIHTQSPCATCPSGFATGGLDDRFDMFLPTYNMKDGEGLDLIASTYTPVGNDGLHYDKNITDSPTIPEGSAYATALWNASDHLPIRVDVQLPAMISAPATLAFGTVIVGATANQNLAVSNPAPVPADELDYLLSAPAGFTAPGGGFVANAGAPAGNHAIGMLTATSGAKSGSLLIQSDAPDAPETAVALSGTVLDHAQASLDSTAALLATTLDFGSQPAGGFPTLMARVHDRGYDAQRARLSVLTGTITGGDGRFSIVGGFSPALVAGTARTYTLQFDDAGATQDLDYDATLTFTSADEPLPGAAAQPDLVVTLHAKVTSGTVGLPDGPAPPATTRLLAPYPNPVIDRAGVRFDLAEPAELRLDVHDVAGRRVATLADGVFAPGRHERVWEARAEGGARLGAGLYFVRMTIAGAPARTARMVLVR